MTTITIILLLFSAAVFIIGIVFTIYSLIEKEPRAAIRGFILTVVTTAGFLLATLLPDLGEIIFLSLILSVLGIAVLLFFLPTQTSEGDLNQPEKQVDERTIIFARARLDPETDRYRQYYQQHPEHKEADDAARSQPGLLDPKAKFTDPYSSAATSASFFLTEALREAVDGEVSTPAVENSPEELTEMVKKLAEYYGALDCGITELNESHIYSHIGRGTGTYGDPVTLNHKYGIAFTVEMDFEMTGSAPYPPISMESSRQYVEFARVGVQLAAAIRELGYPARAHIDGNYRVIAPLVARDAGLGEIGRMSLLMTPRLGPRVRVGVVTTDLPLIPDSYQPDLSTLHFCEICEKCAENCPSNSIPYGGREISNGTLRWTIDPESCYHYWTVVGTDCGRCMAVCPYSHPDNFIHNIVRWGIRKSGNFRRAALALDDFFYGRKPRSRSRSFLT